MATIELQYDDGRVQVCEAAADREPVWLRWAECATGGYALTFAGFMLSNSYYNAAITTTKGLDWLAEAEGLVQVAVNGSVVWASMMGS